MAKNPWKPWHEVVKLRDDLRSGELPMHMFAADLYEVMMQKGKHPLYEKPDKFFALTFPTYNLRQLVRDVMLRLAGKNDKAVRQLELTYGGGKTHTLITLRHLVFKPDTLPDLPAVHEFVQEIGENPPPCRVAGLCFDKLDVEKGMSVNSPEGKIRILKNPWSVLAWQIAGDKGLQLLHAENKSEERDSAPAENLLTELLAMPSKDKLGTLILIDEVLMYAREKIGMNSEWRSRLVNFFQYLTQAAAKVDKCCIVASLLATDPRKSDTLGREIQAELYDIFQRQREEAVEPVGKEDVAEVLRRRFFTPESLKNRSEFKQHVMAALKGISVLDEQTAKAGAEAEERFLKSFPFHPDLTEVMYSKWTQLSRFQRTRGVLRTFALALREAEKWDTCPLIGPGVFLASADKESLSESMRELITVADTEEWEGKKQNWTGILDNELTLAKRIQLESVGLKNREIEQAVVAVFLHSQPIGQNGHTRDLMLLLGSERPDKIELEKGLTRWAQSSFWLDDMFAVPGDNRMPSSWRLGNRPNLNQMHSVASKNIPDDIIRARLLEDIGKTKSLTANASTIGVKTHTLPEKPRDIEDDGLFHYAVLGPDAASESGKPSAIAKRFLDETTGSDRPRVFRNAVILLVPSRDGLELAFARVREYLAWETVREEIRKQQKDGNVDPARAQTLQVNIDKAKNRIPDSIRQAYSIIVTVSEKDEDQAFKVTIIEDAHFNIIKADKRSRIQETAVTAEALLPDGPYNLWRPGETFRRVKDLAGAFAQFTHLPKMLKTGAILETLSEGCSNGFFVLRLPRPDGTKRTWWMSRPEDSALSDPAMELVLPQGSELMELSTDLFVPEKLPGLWTGQGIKVKDVFEYFKGGKTVSIIRHDVKEPLQIPKAGKDVVEKALESAIQFGLVWLVSGPASILGESVPQGILTETADLLIPPSAFNPAELLPENLPNAWKEGIATGLSISTALSQKAGRTLPWKTIRDSISSAVQSRFMVIAPDSCQWPCDFISAQFARMQMAQPGSGGKEPGHGPIPGFSNILVAEAEMEPGQIQELGDEMAKLLDIKNKAQIPLKFTIKVKLGDGKKEPPKDVAGSIEQKLKSINKNLGFGQDSG